MHRAKASARQGGAGHRSSREPAGFPPPSGRRRRRCGQDRLGAAPAGGTGPAPGRQRPHRRTGRQPAAAVRPRARPCRLQQARQRRRSTPRGRRGAEEAQTESRGGWWRCARQAAARPAGGDGRARTATASLRPVSQSRRRAARPAGWLRAATGRRAARRWQAPRAGTPAERPPTRPRHCRCGRWRRTRRRAPARRQGPAAGRRQASTSQPPAVAQARPGQCKAAPRRARRQPQGRPRAWQAGARRRGDGRSRPRRQQGRWRRAGWQRPSALQAGQRQGAAEGARQAAIRRVWGEALKARSALR